MKFEQILDEITKYYIASHDFNGMPVSLLLRKFKLSWPDLRDSLIQLIEDKKITMTFASIFENPHIKAFEDLSPTEQIKKLQFENPDWICAYPTTFVIERTVDVTEYNDRPFTKRIMLGEPQLKPIFFELSVLERYYADPRYSFEFDDFSGRISISNPFYEAEETNERDKVFLQTFGLGHDSKKNRVAVVFLRYLSYLSPEHQQYWNTYVHPGECKMNDDYYRMNILGEWLNHGSIYRAFLEEQVVINEMCQLMGRPPLFRETYKNNRPREFSVFLRPTLSNYLSFIHCLDKLLSENTNKDFFQNEVSLEKVIQNPDGTIQRVPLNTITIFNEWLRAKTFADKTFFDAIIKPLRKVRDLRQKPAHIIQQDEYDLAYYGKQDDLMDEVYGSLMRIRMLFARHPKVREYKVPDWLYEGRIRKY